MREDGGRGHKSNGVLLVPVRDPDPTPELRPDSEMRRINSRFENLNFFFYFCTYIVVIGVLVEPFHLVQIREDMTFERSMKENVDLIKTSE